ncbi:drug resistance transporter, EmrB/QacA subfamily [Streptomyces zhaozhouensis]|uniref:Drug resistance transporter, EmrB/QacA subfamily n=1 Tax=Streptomyces zhaozhouensis TaxID=1300267 RepID=A0A286E8X6_9ACTN|nr:MFS transporter [Streptomyces zhaozhouensis]SOD67356.1 drug resistance transporter, EmrB/QacA subfamily [Streptomyces zhaozhouensis]
MTHTQRATAHPGTALAVLAGAQFTVMLATSIVNVALPQIRAGVGLSDSGTTWVVNAYGLAFGVLLLAGGRVADLLGRRRVLLAGMAVFAFSSFAAGLAASPVVLIAARAVQGLGAAAIAPSALALVLSLFPPGPARGRALGVWGAVSGAGAAAGVLLGGALTQAWGWPWIFHVTGAGALLVLVAGALRLPRVPAADRGRFDLAGTLTVTLSLTAVVWGLTTARAWGWTDARVLGAFALSAVSLVAFALVERRHRDPLVPPGLFAGGQVVAGNILMALLGSVWIALFFFLPLYQQQVLGAGPLATGLGQLPLAAANMIGSTLSPRVARRVGARAAVAGALLVEAGGLLWLSRISPHGGYAADVLGPSVLIGLGLGAAFVQLTAVSVGGVRPADAGVAGGLVNTTRQVGGAVGLAVLATLAGSRTADLATHLPRLEALTAGYRLAFGIGAAVIATAALLALVAVRRTSAPDPGPPATAVARSPARAP